MSAIAVSGGVIWTCHGSEVVARDREGRALRTLGASEARSVATAGSCVFVGSGDGVWCHRAGAGAPEQLHAGGAVHGLCVDPEAAELYAATSIGILTLAAGAARTIAHVPRAKGLALAPDRRRLYVAAGPSVVAVSLTGDAEPHPVAQGLDDCVDVCITPAGLAAVDRSAGLLGINLRHASARAIWPRLERPVGVAFDWDERAYLVIDADNRRLLRIALDGSGAAAIWSRVD